MDFEAILPATGKFFAYPGSLTTPPLTQCVKWILLHDPLYFSKAALDSFRALPKRRETSELYHKDDIGLCDNFRPPQPICDRIVEANFNII